MRQLPGLLLIHVLALPALLAGPSEADDLARRLTSLHTRVYALENLLLKPYGKGEQDDLADWRRLMAALTGFVQAKGTPEAATMMASLNEASEQLIKERQRSWTLAIQKCLAEPEGLSRLDRSKISFAKLDLADVIQGDSALQFKNRSVAKIVEDAGRMGKDGRKLNPGQRDALDLVGRLALTLQLTFEKYHNDLVALNRAKAGK